MNRCGQYFDWCVNTTIHTDKQMVVSMWTTLSKEMALTIPVTQQNCELVETVRGVP